jgi:phosphopantetheinyl transferase (holo-ACP synthase)
MVKRFGGERMTEIEKLKAEIWNKHYSTQEAFSKAIDKLVSLVTISQLKEIKTILKKYEHFKFQPMVTELNNLLKALEKNSEEKE